MSRKRRSLTSVLARSSTVEGLKPRSEIVQELAFYIRQALSKEHADFLVTINKARGFPARLSERAQYPRTVKSDELSYRPTQELIRRVLLWGHHGPNTDENESAPDPNESRIIPAQDCELLADCTIYCHSARLGWELAVLKLFYSDDGWHEPVTRVFQCRSWFNEKGGYQIGIECVSPEAKSQ